MKTCLVTIITLCLAGTGLAAPTRAVSARLSQRQPDANLVSAAGAGDRKSGKSASDYYGPVGPLYDATDVIDRLDRGNRGTLSSMTYAVGDLSRDVYDRSDKKEKNELVDGDIASDHLKRANAAEQGELIGSLLDALPLAGLAKREMAAKQGELLGGLLDTLPFAGLVKRGTGAEQGKLLGGLLQGLPLSGLVKRAVTAEQNEQHHSGEGGQLGRHLRRDATLKQDIAAKQLLHMIVEGLAAQEQGAGKVHNKRDSEALGINGLVGEAGGRLGKGAGLVLDEVLGLLDLDQDGLPVDTKKALNAGPVVSDDNPLAANLAVSAGSQKKSSERLTNGMAQVNESDELVEGKLAKAGAGLAAGKLSQANNSTFVVGQPKPQQAN